MGQAGSRRDRLLLFGEVEVERMVVCRKTSNMDREERVKVTRVLDREDAVNEREQAGKASRLSLGFQGVAGGGRR